MRKWICMMLIAGLLTLPAAAEGDGLTADEMIAQLPASAVYYLPVTSEEYQVTRIMQDEPGHYRFMLGWDGTDRAFVVQWLDIITSAYQGRSDYQQWYGHLLQEKGIEGYPVTPDTTKQLLDKDSWYAYRETQTADRYYLTYCQSLPMPAKTGGVVEGYIQYGLADTVFSPDGGKTLIQLRLWLKDGSQLPVIEDGEELVWDMQQAMALLAEEGTSFGIAGPGDVNLDGCVDARDALCVLKAAVGQDCGVSETLLKCFGDLDLNRQVNAADALWILQQAVYSSTH